MVRAGSIVLSIFALAGCERGCLARRAAERTSSPPIDLSGTDCPDGLARCVDGRVEISRLAQAAAEILATGWDGKREPRKLLAALGLALDFHTWQTLTRRSGMTTREAVELMAALVESA